MLQHEPQEQPIEKEQAAAIPAAQIRVTSEELAQAINALEASKDEAARHLAGTVPIGEVVQELKLDATPEEVWAQVQKQRAQAQQAKSPPAEAQSAVTVRVTVNGQAAALSPAARRRGMRTWRDIKGWLWILFWCGGGIGLVSGVLHPTPPGVHVSGDNTVSAYNVHHEDATIDGNHNKITLRGDVRHLTVDGDGNAVTVLGTVEAVTVDSNGNQVHWTKEPPGKTIQPAVDGNDNQVGLSAP